jgi:hypothetical protein
MIYRVTKSYGRGPGTDVGSYGDVAQAKREIQKRLADDVLMKIKGVVYSLYEGFDLLEQFDEKALESSSQGGSDDQSGGSKPGSSQSFRPTPLNTAPRPPGSPPAWLKDEDDTKKE